MADCDTSATIAFANRFLKEPCNGPHMLDAKSVEVGLRDLWSRIPSARRNSDVMLQRSILESSDFELCDFSTMTELFMLNLYEGLMLKFYVAPKSEKSRAPASNHNFR